MDGVETCRAIGMSMNMILLKFAKKMCYAESKKGVGIDMSQITGEWKLPKNVRQIGEGGSSTAVYVEDYVMTFLDGSEEKKADSRAVLLGTVKWKQDRKYIFVDGAVEADSIDQMEEEKQKYFKEKSVVGWFLRSEESPFTMKGELAKEVPPEEPVLLVQDILEQETSVFLLEKENFVRQPGYYIYYEKNTPMQEYMIAKNSGKSVEEQQPEKDEAIKHFRRIIKKKDSEKEKKEKKTWKLPETGRLSYLAGAGLTVTILALGVTMIYNYDRMKVVEKNLAMITNNIDSQSQYLEENNTAQVMLHLDEEMTTALEENESDQTEETMMQQGEKIQFQETEQEKETEQTDQAAETLRENNRMQAEESEVSVQPAESDTEKSQETPAMAATAGRAFYTVKMGDTLAGISEMYYGTIDKVGEICALNGIDDENTIVPGQKVLLP